MANIESIPGWRDMDAAELVAFGAANPQTATPYPVDELTNWLRENGLAFYGLDSSWQGVLPAIAQNEQTPIEFRMGLVAMLSHLRNPKSVQVDTNLDSYAPLLGALLASTGLSAEQIAEFYRRDGGRMYPLFATEAEATAAKEAAIEAETLAGLRARIVNAAALMGERVAVDSDPFELFAACWEDAV
jgi:hypothetical protein